MSIEGCCEGKRVIDNHKIVTLSDTGKQKFGHVRLELEDKLCTLNSQANVNYFFQKQLSFVWC